MFITKIKTFGIVNASIITELPTKNPKRPGSLIYKRFENYFKFENGCTVSDLVTTSLNIEDIRRDFRDGYIKIKGAELLEYTPKLRTKKKKKR